MQYIILLILQNAKPAVVTIDKNIILQMEKRFFAEYSRYYRIIKQNYIVENVTDTTFELKDIDSRYMNNFGYFRESGGSSYI